MASLDTSRLLGFKTRIDPFEFKDDRLPSITVRITGQKTDIGKIFALLDQDLYLLLCPVDAVEGA